MRQPPFDRSSRTKGNDGWQGASRDSGCHSPDCCPTALARVSVEIFTLRTCGWANYWTAASSRVGCRGQTERSTSVRLLTLFCRRFQPWKYGGASPNKGLEPSTIQFDRVRGLVDNTLGSFREGCSGVRGQGAAWRNFDYLF